MGSNSEEYPRRTPGVQCGETFSSLERSELRSLQQYSDPSLATYFQELFHPLGLHVNSQQYCDQTEAARIGALGEEASSAAGTELLDSRTQNALRERIVTEGYFQLAADELRVFRDLLPAQHDEVDSSSTASGLMAEAVVRLLRRGWPPSFLLMCDEAWAMAAHMERLVSETTGGNRSCFDYLVWYVDPSAAPTAGDLTMRAGFSPHRDRQPHDVAASFRADGTPRYATCWLPLTDACPENSCLYMLPAHADPGYHDGDLPAPAPDPLQRALHDKHAFQQLRCLPAPRGSACVFTHRVIHWGSAGRKGYHTPRIAVSVACADPQFERPYLLNTSQVFPSLSTRFALCCAQMIVYHERFHFTAKQLLFFRDCFERSHELFHPDYVSKVRQEFVSAARETSSAVSVDGDAQTSSSGVIQKDQSRTQEQQPHQGKQLANKEEAEQKEIEDDQHKKGDDEDADDDNDEEDDEDEEGAPLFSAEALQFVGDDEAAADSEEELENAMLETLLNGAINGELVEDDFE